MCLSGPIHFITQRPHRRIFANDPRAQPRAGPGRSHSKQQLRGEKEKELRRSGVRAGGSQGHGKERGEGDDRNEGVKTSSHKGRMAPVALDFG